MHRVILLIIFSKQDEKGLLFQIFIQNFFNRYTFYCFIIGIFIHYNQPFSFSIIYQTQFYFNICKKNGEKEMARLVYIHKGRETKNGRNELKNVYYKAYVGEEPEDIWIATITQMTTMKKKR